MDIEIIFQNEDFIAVNKPAPLVVHFDGITKEPSLTDWIEIHFPELKDLGRPIITANATVLPGYGIVHRIDRETSGIVLIAKNANAYMGLKAEFFKRTVAKEYDAFVYGKVENKEGTIDFPIGRSRADYREWTIPPHTRGKLREATTSYKVISADDEVSFVQFFPKTGRTHQIRVHAKAIGHPVVGDKRYAPEIPTALGFKRLALHARKLTFTFGGKEYVLEAAYPQDFAQAMRQRAISLA